MTPAPGTVIRTTRRYTLVAVVGAVWASVEGIRLEPGEPESALEEVRSFLAETNTRIASWWLTERSTPADLEERLLAAGVERKENDYLHDAMLVTTPPPAGPREVEARAVAGVDEHLAARRLQHEGFDIPADEQRSDDALVAEYGRGGEVLYAAWLDGRMAAAAGAAFASCGALLVGGTTLPWARGRGAYRALVRARWDDAVARGTPVLTVGAGPMSAPILRRLGFEKVLQLRRLQSLASTG